MLFHKCRVYIQFNVRTHHHLPRSLLHPSYGDTTPYRPCLSSAEAVSPALYQLLSNPLFSEMKSSFSSLFTSTVAENIIMALWTLIFSHKFFFLLLLKGKKRLPVVYTVELQAGSSLEQEAPQIAEFKKIDKKQVVCFLKDYDRSYDTKFERKFPVVKLYTAEEVASKKSTAFSGLAAAMDETNATETTTTASTKEKQLFSPGTKKTVDEIANTIGVETFGVVKRAITFAESSSALQSIPPTENAVSMSNEAAMHVPAAGSPTKKSKNLLPSK